MISPSFGALEWLYFVIAVIPVYVHLYLFTDSRWPGDD